MLKTGPIRPLMHVVFEKLDECDGRMSKLLIGSTNDERETNFPIKPTYREISEVVYLSKMLKGILPSKLLIEQVNDKKTNLGSKVKPEVGNKNGRCRGLRTR